MLVISVNLLVTKEEWCFKQQSQTFFYLLSSTEEIWPKLAIQLKGLQQSNNILFFEEGRHRRRDGVGSFC